MDSKHVDSWTIESTSNGLQIRKNGIDVHFIKHLQLRTAWDYVLRKSTIGDTFEINVQGTIN